MVALFVATGYWFGLRAWVDPRPAAVPSAIYALATAAVPAGGAWQTWLPAPQLAGGGTVQMTAAHAGGEQDMVYGVLVGTAANYLAVGISPLGYVVLESVQDGSPTPLLPLQTFPHVRGGTAANIFTVALVAEGELVVRLNGEWLWQGPAPEGGQIGLWGRSFGGAAVVDFQQAAVWNAP